MFDGEGLEKDLQSRSASLSSARSSKTRKEDYSWLNLGAIDPSPRRGDEYTPYIFRLMPEHHLKCPSGYHKYTLHKIQMDAEGGQVHKILCTESYAPDEPCYLCELAQLIESECRGEVEARRPDLWAALEMLYPFRSFLFPAVFHNLAPVFKKIPKATGGDQDVIDSAGYAKDATPMGAILCITNRTVLRRMADLTAKFPGLNSPTKGLLLDLVKKENGHTVLDVHSDERSALENKEFWLDDKRYPNFPAFGKYARKDYTAIESLVQAAWFAKPLSKWIDLSSDDSN